MPRSANVAASKNKPAAKAATKAPIAIAVKTAAPITKKKKGTRDDKHLIITAPSVRRQAHRGGVIRLHPLAIHHTNWMVRKFLRKSAKDAVILANLMKRKVLGPEEILQAFRLNNYPLYGFRSVSTAAVAVVVENDGGAEDQVASQKTPAAKKTAAARKKVATTAAAV